MIMTKSTTMTTYKELANTKQKSKDDNDNLIAEIE